MVCFLRKQVWYQPTLLWNDVTTILILKNYIIRCLYTLLCYTQAVLWFTLTNLVWPLTQCIARIMHNWSNIFISVNYLQHFYKTSEIICTIFKYSMQSFSNYKLLLPLNKSNRYFRAQQTNSVRLTICYHKMLRFKLNCSHF